MDDGAVERHEEQRERREELRRMAVRFVVAVALDLFTGVYKRAAGFEGSDPNSGTETTENEHRAFFWASGFNKAAHFSFMLVIFQILASVVVLARRMRSFREDCDMKLLLGLICVTISLSLMAYLRWWVSC
ncbi:T26F17.18 [Arabidopsis thaliana]|uniref:T26F17.18 n=3 Tax=Arabidopsis TaxID=3701 RepID=Q9SFE0_ARATH|nr:uncharacterized protein AT1G21950 [Arabidopsis thaliana]KAG7655137.1 hypothetical protein ISN44_As01g022380 [Arabidopsis suecica]AAF16538.1 T26F17.18 [Arabidopsis thaliana]AAV68827.1 hypothetical protein AT1G21950 [Arabidopsis thaliana]AAX23754.1 hypothetical protein At1g21950 [Arabidopsis thaliana]AEE30177.1 transmembrane protein [Arabidopsis thaliana]|eukprot:NP_173614.2 transmembrane protein [Arabidopsis thaliana]